MGKNNYDYKLEGSEVESEVGKYRLCKGIGHGGNGDVYAVEVISGGTDLPKGEQFALKVLKKDEFSDSELTKREQRFKKEVDLTCQIQNKIQGIIPVYDSSDFTDVGNMEWYLMPLAKKYNFKHKSSTKEILKNVKNVGESILALHGLGYAHRDIKPANLMLYHQRLCISDFGLACNTQEDDPQITGINDHLGPLGIRPPEMRRVGAIKDSDYEKSDVYLFAKTLWIILTRREEGFEGEYNRSNEDMRFNSDDLQVETAGPLHLLLEMSTKYFCKDRINMQECINLINKQLEIIDGEMDRSEINDWKYNDALVVFQEKYIPDIETYYDSSDIIKIMTRLKGLVSLRFTEIGREYGLLTLRNVSLLSGNIFELEVRDEIQKKTKRIRLAVNNFGIKKDNKCEIRTGIISDKPNDDFPLINNLKDALESLETCIYINGNFVIKTDIYNPH